VQQTSAYQRRVYLSSVLLCVRTSFVGVVCAADVSLSLCVDRSSKLSSSAQAAMRCVRCTAPLCALSVCAQHDNASAVWLYIERVSQRVCVRAHGAAVLVDGCVLSAQRHVTRVRVLVAGSALMWCGGGGWV
jgi:hypothetical protein